MRKRDTLKVDQDNFNSRHRGKTIEQIITDEAIPSAKALVSLREKAHKEDVRYKCAAKLLDKIIPDKQRLDVEGNAKIDFPNWFRDMVGIKKQSE